MKFFLPFIIWTLASILWGCAYYKDKNNWNFAAVVVNVFLAGIYLENGQWQCLKYLETHKEPEKSNDFPGLK